MKLATVLAIILLSACSSSEPVQDEPTPQPVFEASWSSEVMTPFEFVILASEDPPSEISGWSRTTAQTVVDIAGVLAVQMDVPDSCFDGGVLLVPLAHDFAGECGYQMDDPTLLGCYLASGREMNFHGGAYAIVVRPDMVWGPARETLIRHELRHRALECLTGDSDATHSDPRWH